MFNFVTIETISLMIYDRLLMVQVYIFTGNRKKWLIYLMPSFKNEFKQTPNKKLIMVHIYHDMLKAH